MRSTKTTLKKKFKVSLSITRPLLGKLHLFYLNGVDTLIICTIVWVTRRTYECGTEKRIAETNISSQEKRKFDEAIS